MCSLFRTILAMCLFFRSYWAIEFQLFIHVESSYFACLLQLLGVIAMSFPVMYPTGEVHDYSEFFMYREEKKVGVLCYC